MKKIKIIKKVANANIGDILYWNDDYKIFMNKDSQFSIEYIKNNSSMFEVFEEKSTEQLANELGFKVGDKCWNKNTKEYLGKILCFKQLLDEIYIVAELEGKDNNWCINYEDTAIINKVAIHCSNKEDMIFMYKLLGYQYIDIRMGYYYNYVYVNGTLWASSYMEEPIKNHLILSVDEYCKAINIKQLFITEEKINVYNPEQLVYYIFANNIEYCKANRVVKNCDKLLFSSKQAAQQYLDRQIVYIVCKDNTIDQTTVKSSIIYGDRPKFKNREDAKSWLDSQILFYTEDFKDGTFPVKSCSNCSIKDSLAYFRCIECKEYSLYKGKKELKGEPIRKGEEYWDINKDSIQYKFSSSYIKACETSLNDKDNTTKYFSNETNARNYYNKLVEEPKFKWLADQFQVLHVECDVKPSSIYGKIFDTKIEAEQYFNYLKLIILKNTYERELINFSLKFKKNE